MRRTLLLLLIAFSFQLSNAKSVVGSYELAFFNKSFVVEAGNMNGNKFDIYLEVKGAGSSNTSISIKSKDLEKFKKSLLQMKNKYEEWSETATDNNITNMNKLMDVKFPQISVFWHTPSKVYFSVRNNINPVFTVMEDGAHVAVIAQTVEASMNRYINETIYWAFSSPQEIDELLSLLDKDKLIQAATKGQNLNDLFN